MGFNFYFSAYYFSVIFSFSVYLFFAKRFGIPLYSFSNVFYIGGFILSFLPGYYVAGGRIDDVVYDVGYHGFDFELYFIYLITSIITPGALLVGAALSGNKYLNFEIRTFFLSRYRFFTICCFAYALFFFIWLPVIPLAELFTKGLGAAYEARLQVTHGFAMLEPPFFFKYWRSFLQNYTAFLFFVYFAIEYKKKNKIVFLVLKIKWLILFSLVCFCYLYTIEKAAIVQFFLAFYFIVRITRLSFDFSWTDSNRLFSFYGVFLVCLMLVFLVLISYFFMGGEFYYAFSRIARQDASNYLQIQYVRENGYTGLSGLNSFWLGKLGIEKAPDISVLTIQQMFSRDIDEGAGAAGGMFSTNMFFMCGWWFIPFSFAYVFLLGFFDKILINTMLFCKGYAFAVLLALYVLIMANFSLAALADFQNIFSLSYFLSPQLIILFGLLLFFLKLRVFNSIH